MLLRDEPLRRSPELAIDAYTPEDDAAALALERASPQGRGLRLAFVRDHFHLRAARFDEHRILVARAGGELAGTAAVAWKHVVLGGAPKRAAFYFDLRVHPNYRGRGVAKALGRAITALGDSRSDFGYSYSVADNRAAQNVARVTGAEDVGSYAYLVAPARCARRPAGRADEAAAEDVHRAMLDLSEPFDLYTDPFAGGSSSGRVGSWLVRRGRDVAGCSAWTNRGVLSEMVLGLSWYLRLARPLLSLWPFRCMRAPRIPERGETLASWYLHDFFATSAELARELLRSVCAEARDRGIDFCYVPHLPSDRWAGALRRDLPRLFSPVVRYKLLVRSAHGPAPRPPRFYLDVRDT